MPLDKYYDALRSSIRRGNEELFHARTRDQAAAANAKLEMLRKEDGQILDHVKAAGIEGLLRGEYATLAYLNGRMVVVPSADFAGEVDWENESLRSAERTYTRLRLIHSGKLTPEQRDMIGSLVKGEETSADTQPDAEIPNTTGAPGRPTSMHLVESEFHRRAEEGLIASTLVEESKQLSEWLKRTYPKAPPATPKTIRNRSRDAYRALSSSS